MKFMASNETPKENKMGTMPVNKLLLTMSFPMMLSMLVQALYNIVDSIFVAKLGQDALQAVSLTFPLQNLLIAFASGTAVGINALLSKSLGEKDFDRANKAAVNGLFLAAVHYVIFLIIGVFFARFFFAAQTSNTAVIENGVIYAGVCLGLSFGSFFQVTLERLLLSTGKSFYSMITQMTGAIINLIFDPLLIFGIGFFPRLGVLGAAVATVGGQMVAALLALYFNIRVNTEIKISLRGFRPILAIIKRIYSVGLPSIIMISIASIMTFGINKILRAFDELADTAQTVFGIYYKLQSFVFMPVFGLNNGMVPIIAYNYGARRPERMTKTIRLAVTYAVILMLAGFAIFQIFTEPLLNLFSDTPGALSEIGVPALRIISISFILAGFNVICGSVFQAVGNGILSMIVSIVRQLVVLLPAAYLLSLAGSINLVWYSFPIAELASLIISIIFLARTYKKVIKPLAN
ncbi:MAG: MATE family efflux transporter [Clostridia bacterium]|nr:MATE family efflux transporter [Clostridia bacterium]